MRFAPHQLEIADLGTSDPESKPKTWPGSTNYRMLPSEQCHHGIYPIANCPACCPGKKTKKYDVTASMRMKHYHQRHQGVKA